MTHLLLYLVMLVTGARPPQAPAERQPPPATATIRGRVIAGDTGQPVRKAAVRLNPAEGQAEGRVANTDGDGAYEFKNLPAGRYVLSASKAPYVGVSWGQPRAYAPGTPLELRIGETIERVDVTLSRGAVIAGRIVDEFGEPLSGLEIRAMPVQIVNGRRQPVHAGAYGSTNDIGEFRIFGLVPGQYSVMAVWRRIGADDPTSPDRSGYAPTFFPGTTLEAEAQRFTVAAGQSVGGLVMALSPIRTARVEGTVVDVDGRPAGIPFLEVLHSTANSNSMGRQSVRPDGTFTFASLTPGEYVLRTQPTPSRQIVAMMKLTVGSEDITDLRLVALPLATVSGRIVVDPSLPPPSTLSLVATLEDRLMPGAERPATVADDFTFEMTAMPGKNRITPRNLPSGWAIRSVRVHDVEAIDDGFEVKPGEKITGVDVELTTKIAVITGLVTNAGGAPAKDSPVLLFPTDSRRWKVGSRYLQAPHANQDGRFTLSGLVPADYYLIAVDKLEENQQYDPEFLERIRSKATSVTIGEGETKTVDLKVTTAS